MIKSTRIFGGRRITAIVWRKSFAGALLAFALLFVAAGAASAETRTLKLYFVHTKERAEITYKRDGRYIGSGLDKVNRFLRDWRRNEPTKMDPKLLDTVWEIYQKVGARDYINVVSAYRSPATNSMLRSRSKGVAKSSQHMLGKAMDFYIPGVSLAKLRATALKVQHGGVGYYPRSGSPFVHVDVGSVRHWPRMQRNELMAIFPDGKTMHVPTDGKPLQGYNQAVAAYNAYKSGGSGRVQIASSGSDDAKPRRGLLAVLFGGGADDEEDSADNGQPGVAIERAEQPLDEGAVADTAILPQPATQTPETVLAALAPAAVPLPRYAPRPGVDVGEPLALAQTLYSSPQTANAAANALIPFGNAATPLGENEVALNIPVPTPRPDYAPAPIDGAVQIADASSGLPLPGLPSGSPFQPEADAAPVPSATVAAFLPSGLAGEDNSREYVLASLPDAGPTYGAPPISTDPNDAVSNTQNTDGRLARLAAAPAASPRAAMLQGGGKQSRDSLATGVKTTAKGSKPGPNDTKPDPRTVLVPIPQQVARWALDPKPTAMEKRGTRAPSFAHDIVHTAPQMVYTAGFQSENGQAQPNRFTGKAVTFLTVARFTRKN